MTMRSWIRKVVARPATHPIRKVAHRARLALEALEERVVPATFTVNSLSDNGSAGTLRYAINQANFNGQANTINFDANVFSSHKTITLGGSVLMLTNIVGTQTITGPAAGVTISGGNQSGVFELKGLGGSVVATVSGVTITGGNTSYNGGGVFNVGSKLTLTSCTISGNTAAESGGGLADAPDSSDGFRYGSATLNNCTISNNKAAVGNGGGVYCKNGETLTLNNCTISGNSAVYSGGTGGEGGGVCTGSGFFNGTATLTGCTISNNSAPRNGGGISNTFLAMPGSQGMTLSACTISGNTSSGTGTSFGVGGGLANFGTVTLTGSTIGSGNSATNSGGGAYNNGSMTLADCTVSGNSSKNAGGGVANNQQSSSSTLTLTSCTISGNSAGSGAGVYNTGGTTLKDTIVAGNTLTNSSTPSDISSPVTVVSGSYNLIGPGGSGSITNFGQNHNIILSNLTTLRLASLDNYGGPTQTMALLPGSAAIDAGTSGSGIPTTDQRGQGRVNAPDIGAVESQGYTLTPVSGSTPQMAGVGQAFSAPLAVTVKPNYASDPVNGVVVAFAAPTSGASATLSASSVTFASGSASVTATANNTAGAFTVTASASGVANRASFSLQIVQANLVVNTTADPATPVNGQNSLREAIAYADSLSGVQTVTFDTLVFGATPQTITLTSGQLSLAKAAGVTGSIIIQGPGAALLSVSGNNASQDLQVNSGATATLSGMTFTNGFSATDNGGIANFGTLILTSCSVSGNHANGSNGGIGNFGTLTLTSCSVNGNSANSNNGGIANFGTLTLNSCTLNGNSAGGNSGGIGSAGPLTVTNSTLTTNTAGHIGGGIGNSGPLTINNDVFANNSARGADGSPGGFTVAAGTYAVSVFPGGNGNAGQGGALGSVYGTVSITNSTFTGNTAVGGAGGKGGDGKPITLPNGTSTTVAATNGGAGGAAQGGAVYFNGGNMSIVNSMFGGTSAQGDTAQGGAGGAGGAYLNTSVAGSPGNGGQGGDSQGGAIWAGSGASGVSLTLVNTTFKELIDAPGLGGASGVNTPITAPSGKNGSSGTGKGGWLLLASGAAVVANDTFSNAGFSGGGIALVGGALTLNNTILGIVTGGDIVNSGGTLTGAYNLISDGTYTIAGLTQTIHADPKLSLPANNGGPVQTMALLAGSPAIDAGSNALVPAGITTDARGNPRIVKGISTAATALVDIGAFEYPDPVGPTGDFIVNSTLDDGSDGTLRWAVDQANATPGPNTITFDPAVFTTAQTIALGGSQLELSDTSGATTITGPEIGVTVSAGGQSRLFQVDSGVTAALSGLTLTGGAAPQGGGLYNAGATTLTDATISGNSAADKGGGVFTANGGTTTLIEAVVTGNSAVNGGGGLYNQSGGTTTLNTNTTVNYNTCTSNGGGLDNAGALTLTNVTVSGNSANNGGGLYTANGGTTTLTQTTVSGNRTSNNGGGLYTANGGMTTLTEATISGNSAANKGGGLNNAGGGTTTLNSSTTVNDNTAIHDGGGGLSNSGTANLDDTTISGNTGAGLGGGGVANFFGAATLTNCTITGNFENAGGGAGLLSYTSTIKLTDCTVSGNVCFNTGSGLYIRNGTATLDGCTVSNNTVKLIGGGLFNGNGTTTLTNCTLSGNSAGRGAGLYTNGSSGTTTLTNCTVSGNSAGAGGGVFTGDGGTTYLTDSTVTGNSAFVGGGVYNGDPSTTTLTRATVSGTSAGNTGSGVYNTGDGTTALTDTTVSGNSAGNSGSGVVNNGGTVNQDAMTTVSGNTAAMSGGDLVLDPTFSNLAPESIVYGTTTTTLTSHIGAGDNVPLETFISVTLDSVTEFASVDDGGNFTATFDTSSLGVAAGPYTITCAFAGNAAFNAVTDTSATLTVNPAPLSVTAVSTSMTYGDAAPALSYTYDGLVNGDTSATFSGSPAAGATPSSSAGDYAIGQGDLAATGNYTIQTFAAGTLTVTPRDATVTADSQTRIYGAANSTLTATVQGTVNGDVLDFTLATAADPHSTVGSVPITVTLGTNGNYHVTSTDGTLTIDKAYLTVTADDQGKTYDGSAFTPFTATLTGFVNDDTAAAVTGSAAFNGSATTAVDAGSYSFTPSLGSLTAANYDFTSFISGTLSIHKADATITVAGYSGAYDGAAHGASLVSATGVDAGGTALGTSFTTTTVTDISGGTASWTFHGGVNYNDQSGTAAVAITAPGFLAGNAGTFTDSDGDRYTVKLTGAGKVAVGQDNPTSSGKGPIQWILVQGTDPARSVLTVTVVKAKTGDGLVSIGSIEGTGLKSIAASHSDLLGTGIRLTDLLGGVTVHDVAANSQLVAGGTAAQSTTISAHVIGTGTVIQLGSSIASFTAATVQGGSITAPSIGTLTIAGDAQFKVNGVRSPIAGDFNATLTLTGTGNLKKPTALGRATIAGSIQNALWNISGDSGSATARGTITGWTANVHGKLAGLTLGSVAQASVTVDQALATLSARGWTAGALSAASLGTLSITGDLGANVTLTGAGLAARAPALGSATITGTVSGNSIHVAGSVNSFSAGAFLSSALYVGFVPTDAGDPLGGGMFSAGLKIGSFTVTGLAHQSAAAFVNSTVAAATVGSVSLKSVQASNGGQKYGILAHAGIGSVRVTSPGFAFNKSRPTPQGSGDFEVEIS